MSTFAGTMELARHSRSEKVVWLVMPHKNSEVAGPGYAEAVEHALCFGWIDGHSRKHDAHSSRLRFTPRRPDSTWSPPNRERAERMIARGLMTEDGLRLVELAKERGTWQVLPSDPDAVPEDLRAALAADDLARAHFEGFPRSARQQICWWIVTAKRPETRARRITRAVASAAEGIRAFPAGQPPRPGRTGRAS
ncbi:MAG TPA: YdeI/OmpD-associated family protein [Nocardia sp.]|nr:YdeI/OmpD-associated family protein [Nocardia sp.]HLS79337.1 YdeI/OmpD-associated family protein [Nocardia sp.]